MPVYRQRRLGVQVPEAARRESDKVLPKRGIDCSRVRFSIITFLLSRRRPELLVYLAPRSKRERSLSRSRGRDVNALQLKHADFSRRATRRGKTTNLTAGRQNPVTGDDQRHRIPSHGSTDIARGLRPGTEFIRQSAIARCVAP